MLHALPPSLALLAPGTRFPKGFLLGFTSELLQPEPVMFGLVAVCVWFGCCLCLCLCLCLKFANHVAAYSCCHLYLCMTRTVVSMHDKCSACLSCSKLREFEFVEQGQSSLQVESSYKDCLRLGA